MNEEETRYAIALTYMTGLSFATALILYRELGGAKAIYDHRHDIRDVVPDCSPRLAEVLKNWSAPLEQADAELQFINKYNIQALPLADDSYPARLRECPDAPIIIYYKGTADLNQKHVINIVGTRHCTTYGQDLVRRFITQLKELCPQVLIVSGLAYGIDICAHRQALASDLETVGVLAHGLEKIYPTQHRDTAAQMIRQGGLLTEFLIRTNADKINFVRRNRIVAGMSDACILVESAAHGGGLITAELAREYNREVFAFPGRVGDNYSEGCNNLIAKNVAALLTGAEMFVKIMGWESDAQLAKAQKHGIPRQLFPELTPEEQQVVKVLQENNDLQINMLSVQSNVPIGRLTALLFQLEMKGVIRTLAGGMYHLLK